MSGQYTNSINSLTADLKTINQSLMGKEVGTADKFSEVAEKIRGIESGYVERNKTYGVKITESNSDPYTRVTYIDDAVGKQNVTVDSSTGKADYHGWNNTWIFEKIYPCMVKSDGMIHYKLDPDDYSKKLDGGDSDIANINYDGNAMVCVEKFYTKFSMSGNDEIIEISEQKKSGFEAIGFIRSDGSEVDRVFLPMFMGSIDPNTKLRSLSGQTIKYNTSWTDFRTAAQKNGSGYDIETWAMNQMFQAVYFILMKNCNPKTALGAGRNYNDGSSKTGLMNTKGAIAYDPTTKAVKFMHVEDYTSNYTSGMMRWEAGILSQNNKIYVKMKPPYSGTSTSGYTEVTDHVGGQNYMSKMKCDNKYGRYGVEYKGSNSTYEAAYWYTQSSATLCVSRRGYRYGVAGRYFGVNPTVTVADIGAALSLLPPVQGIR